MYRSPLIARQERQGCSAGSVIGMGWLMADGLQAQDKTRTSNTVLRTAPG